MLTDPGAIAAAQRDFLDAGAQVVTTVSYQASQVGFAGLGLSGAQFDELLRADARRARVVAESWQEAHPEANREVLVVGSIGPFGAMLNDGSEYRGDYDVTITQLREFHVRRLEVLAETCDLLAIETIPQLREVEALLSLLGEVPTPVWLSVSAEGELLRSGEPVGAAFAMAADVDAVVAVGANCIDPADAEGLARMATAASGKPAVIYPNSGESWSGGQWSGDATTPADVSDWVAAGARMVGGCCRVTPEQIRTMAASLGR
jgi:homocysteine S-methyltransferase